MGADPTAIYDLLNKGGLLAFMVIVGILLTVGSFRKWYVPGWLYEEAKEGANKWETLAKAQQERLDRLITMQETLARRQEETDRAVAAVSSAVQRVEAMMGRVEAAMIRMEALMARPAPRGGTR